MENDNYLTNVNLDNARALKALLEVFLNMTLDKYPSLSKGLGNYKIKIIVTC